ncbi:MAG: SDR family NAD(P)-dependent oxidoreductase [Acidobacteriia bacterium]|nr:SDR family NAD(P)-dependent oxidoreductase [Terriglobia bacterium]
MLSSTKGDRAKATRAAVITGAAQGIGRRTAELLAERGWRLALLDLKSCGETADAAPQRAERPRKGREEHLKLKGRCASARRIVFPVLV